MKKVLKDCSVHCHPGHYQVDRRLFQGKLIGLLFQLCLLLQEQVSAEEKLGDVPSRRSIFPGNLCVVLWQVPACRQFYVLQVLTDHQRGKELLRADPGSAGKGSSSGACYHHCRQAVCE